MGIDVDVLIVGGGCAGLSLAWRLAELGTACPRVLILEKRTTYVNDRTWCFWDVHDARFEGLLAHEWRWLALSAAAKTVKFDCGPTAYQMLAASSFYDRALQVIRACSSITLAQGHAATAEPVCDAAGWRLASTQGPIRAQMVVDTRPRGLPSAGDATLWQSFYGHEVCCEADVFNPDVAQLMDFTPGARGQIPFTYVLPITERRALIEATVFGPEPLGPVALAAQLDAAVNHHTVGHAFEISRSENGMLPMGLTRRIASEAAGYVAVGVMSGGARPSSGFAFQRIQQWADQCCAAIAAGAAPTAHRADPLLVRAMDQLFLQVLRDAPEAAPELFLSLFERADSASVIRFLSGKSSVTDCLKVIMASPAKNFLRQLLACSPAFSAKQAG